MCRYVAAWSSAQPLKPKNIIQIPVSASVSGARSSGYLYGKVINVSMSRLEGVFSWFCFSPNLTAICLSDTSHYGAFPNHLSQFS